MAQRKKIMLVKPQWVSVSRPVFWTYWLVLAMVVIATGLVWGF